jgi:hypothetical protein
LKAGKYMRPRNDRYRMSNDHVNDIPLRKRWQRGGRTAAVTEISPIDTTKGIVTTARDKKTRI